MAVPQLLLFGLMDTLLVYEDEYAPYWCRVPIRKKGAGPDGPPAQQLGRLELATPCIVA